MRTNLLSRTCLLALVALAAACDSDSSYQSPTAPPPLVPPPPAQPVPAPALPHSFAGSITIQQARPRKDCIARAFNLGAGRTWELWLRFSGDKFTGGAGRFTSTLIGSEESDFQFQDQGGQGLHLVPYPYFNDFSLSGLPFQAECVSFDGSSLVAAEITLPPTNLSSRPAKIRGQGTITVRKYGDSTRREVIVDVLFDLERQN